MRWLSLPGFLFLPLALQAEVEKVKLLKIQALAEGAIVTEWQKASASPGETSTNSIFVSGLPESLATGDEWEGYLVRDGAYTGTGGFKIPKYIVANSETEYETSKTSKQKFDPKPTVLIVKNENGSGTAFKAKMDGDSYIVTNLHVIDGSSRNQIYDQEGKPIPIPQVIEIHKKKDLVRFKNKQEIGDLEIEGEAQVDESVTAYGNSQGADVLTASKGKVLGIGPDSLEISCEIVPGNSGGPVVSKNGQLVGVASFLTFRENKWEEKTRFAQVRRFALKLRENEEWWKIDYSTFLKESKTLSNMENTLEEIMDVVVLFGNPSISKVKLSLASQNRTKAQGKVDVAIDSANRRNKSLAGTYYLFFQQLAEACEATIEDGREFWDSEWGKNRFQELSQQAQDYASTIRAHRDNLSKTVFR